MTTSLAIRPPTEEDLSVSSEHRLRMENLAFDIDVWYPSLASFTFPTRFVPLARAEAEAIVVYYQSRFNRRGQLQQRHVHVLHSLEERLNPALAHFPQGAFMRLCGRSPKDGIPLEPHKVLNMYEKSCATLKEEQPSLSDVDVQMLAMARTTNLHVGSAKEAMNLLLTSERVFTDLHDWLRFGEREQIVFRAWEEEIALDFEFRGFVFDHRLRCVSQYDRFGVYQHLVPLQERILQGIVDLWKEIHPHIGLSAYCIDFAWLFKQEKVVFIEISPFLECTCACMFRWDHDYELMRTGPGVSVEGKGDALPTFRLNMYLRDNLKDAIEIWEDDKRMIYESYGAFYATAKMSIPWVPIGMGASMLLSVLHPKTRWWGAGAGVVALAGKYYASRPYRLFVYGTLKRDFHWNHKYLSYGARWIGPAVTRQAWRMVLGQSGVPYVLHDVPGKEPIVGEVWECAKDPLEMLDEYEGATQGVGSRGYYGRVKIGVRCGGRRTRAWMYVLLHSDDATQSLPEIPEYTMEIHKKKYHAPSHILVKQGKYVGNLGVYKEKS